MQAQETILFVVVAALAAALIAALVAPRLHAGNREKKEPSGDAKETTPRPRQRSARPTPATGLQREGEGATRGALLAAVASSPSASLGSPPSPPPLVHMICPTCRRQFAAGLRYCPYDARVLTADLHQSTRPSQQLASIVNAGKICPSCARRYDSAALVCGRDGTALVSVN